MCADDDPGKSLGVARHAWFDQRGSLTHVGVWRCLGNDRNRLCDLLLQSNNREVGHIVNHQLGVGHATHG